ncbi:epidermal growth factor receptor substrate 15-like 1 [Saccostrea echinata]|uniref:epidermal growth factor receptor substrate 15-like 1 n=1 Tax=Saccostrea echinata TaxID=191078 RepID=UPI002A800C47|nr:epidermal growth factor receptor substrate 15-like 1 [Saccostrea echinata]
MEQQVEGGKQQLELLVKSQNDLQLQISQTRQRVQHLNDQERGLKHSIASYSSVNSEVSNIFYSQLQDDLGTRATYGSPVSTISNFSAGSELDDFKEDPFKSNDVFGGDTGGGGSDPFQSDDPFKESGDPSSHRLVLIHSPLIIHSNPLAHLRVPVSLKRKIHLIVWTCLHHLEVQIIPN